MSDSEDQDYPLPRITASKRVVPRQVSGSLTDNPNRAKVATLKAAKKTSVGVTALNNPNTARISAIKATPTRGAAFEERAHGRPPRTKDNLIDGANNTNTAAKTSIRRDPRPEDQALNQTPAIRDQSRPNHSAGNSASHGSHAAPRVPRKVTFNVPEFPLPIERRPTARSRIGQNTGRLNPGFVPPKDRASNPVSFLSERHGPSGITDAQRRGHSLSAQSVNNALDQRRWTAAKARQLHSLNHADPLPGKWARKFEATASRPSLVPRMTSTRRSDTRDNLADSPSERDDGSSFYISAGLTLSNLRKDKSSDNDSVEYSRDTRVGTKAARKFQFGRKSEQVPPERHSSTTDSSTQSSEQSEDEGPAGQAAAREDSEELEYVDFLPPDDVHGQAASPEPVFEEADVAEDDEAPPEMPSDALIEALESVSLGTIRLASLYRLPFTRRNLRDGFLSRCKSLEIDISCALPPHKPVTVVYSCVMRAAENRSPERHVTRTTMKDWKCPLCELHGTFLSWKLLCAHLEWDHSDVGFEWDMIDYTLMIRLPSPTSVPIFPHSHSVLIPSARTTATTSDYSNGIASDNDLATQTSSRHTSVSSHPFRDTSTPNTVKPEDCSPTPRTGSVMSSNPRGTPVSSRASSVRTAGNPVPPPQSDPLGPAAQYPYLPESHSDGVYSCRIGGPRLYDLLNTMPLEPFGVLSWVIIDREEEIFELDDVRDEDKVMQALWFRWIFLNRNKFVANFFNGTKSFIKENWQMIHQAAGLAALRTWLLVLCINNFLVALDVVSLLRYYRGLTGMQHWYDGNNAAGNEVAPV